MKRLTALFFTLAVILLYFVFSVKGSGYTFFTMFYPQFHLILFACVLICGFCTVFCRKKLDISGEFISKVLFYLIPLLMSVTCFIVNRYNIVSPQPEDGIHYVWIAKLIWNGHLALDAPDYYEHYWNNFITLVNGKYTSIFLPGFSFFMAPFAALGTAHLANPLIAGINTYLVGKHAISLKDRRAAVIAMLLFAFSTTHIFHGALYFPHHFGLMLVLISSYLIVHRQYGPKLYFLAGLILSISLLIRTQNAFYAYFAITALIIFKERNIKPLVWFTVPFIFTGSLLMGYNYYFTGDPFIFVQDVYFNVLNTRKFCHRPGFGKGCMGNHGEFLPPDGVTFEYAKGITFLRLNSFIHKISVYPLLLMFIIPAIWKNPYKYFIYYFMPICAVAAYFTFYIEGNYAGPRYLMESGALFIIAAACGFTEIYDSFIKRNSTGSLFLAGSLNGLLAASLIFFSVTIFPATIFKAFDDAYEPHKIKQLLEYSSVKNSIVMLPFSLKFHFDSNLLLQDDPPHDKNGNLIIYSGGDVLDRNIQKFYKDTKYSDIYRIHKNDKGYSLEKLGFLDDDGIYNVEFESKFIPVMGEPYFIFTVFSNVPSSDFEYEPTDKVDMSMWGLGVLFRGGDRSYYGFEHSVKTAGEYELELSIVATECTVPFDIEVNGQIKSSYLPQKGPDRTEKIKFPAHLNAGKNSFRIMPQKDGCLILDRMGILTSWRMSLN
ncbi:MAG TPA: hypothetical protein P5044_02870 [bacterium]|nr:hypothetical protein [bacterium]